ncbi:MAG: DUF1207 domain-containing protein [Gammaproteobacteria bacterium]
MTRLVMQISIVIAMAAVVDLSINVSMAAAPPRDDRYLAGYAAAVLEMQFGLPYRDLRVENGKLLLDPAALQGRDAQEVIESLRAIEGLEVELVETSMGAHTVTASETPIPVSKATGPTTAGWLPKGVLFEPLIADPRWPRFSGTVQFYQDDDELGTVGAPNFGAALPFYGWRAMGVDWQLGLHAGVFSIFDLNADSSDLVNSDFVGGVPLDARYGPLSAQLRIFHQSSHLGDEFLLRVRDQVNRINLSYEAVDLRLSVKPFDWLRFYAGGGAIIRSEPDLDTWTAQGGIEITSPGPIFHPLVYPVVALDVQSSEEADWTVDYSARAGIELRSKWLGSRRLQVLMEYFNGSSPNGQFFERDIEYFGPGVHFYF